MPVSRSLLLIAIALTILVPIEAGRAEQTSPWDGTWTGSFGKRSAISITIAQNKVVNYSFRGAPIAIAYDKLTDSSVSFGDRDHYNMVMTKTGDARALAKYHGHMGFATAALTKR
jgi:hypothetical protein